MKSALKGRRYCDATDLIKNATAELKRLSQNVPNTFIVAVRSVLLHKGTILKDMKVKCLYFLCFSEIQ